MKLRPYQENLVSALTWKNNPRLFLQMPTGTGKTITAIAFMLKRKFKRVVWVAHQTNLVEQSKRCAINTFKGTVEGTSGVRVKNTLVCFHTWQSFRDSPEEYKKSFDLVVGDEIHCGGSETEDVKVSFPKIFGEGVIDNHLYLSATPWALDADLFSQLSREVHLVEYTWQQAVNDGSINDVIFCHYDSALALALADDDGRTEFIQGETTAELAQEAAEAEVNMRDDRTTAALGEAQRCCLFDAFMQEECTTCVPPTLVFCTSVRGEGDFLSTTAMLNWFQEKYPHLRSASVDGADLNTSATLSAFSSGKIDVLFACKMANEGFDYPGLECIIDFALKANNRKRTVQKIGRIMRPLPGKPASRYYFCDSIDKHLKLNGIPKEVMPSVVRRLTENHALDSGVTLTPESAKSAAAVVALAASLNATAGNTEDSTGEHPIVSVTDVTHSAETMAIMEKLNLGPRTMPTTRITKVMFIVKNATELGKVGFRFSMTACLQTCKEGGQWHPGYWTLERCKEEAQKYTSRVGWEKGSGSSYCRAQRQGWLEECCPHMTTLWKPVWTRESCMESAKKYRTKTEWNKGETGAYQMARRKGWGTECMQHMTELRMPVWSLELCMDSASRYTTRKHWERGTASAYHSARRNGWLDDCCAHMKKRGEK